MLMVAVLGRKDVPTDAIEDYCHLLGGAFRERGSEFLVARVAWNESGRLRALQDLWRKSARWKRHWALVQYTALMWSQWGFPFLFLLVLALLRMRGVRTAVVFHDPQAFGGSRLVDCVRRVCQRAVMRWTYRLSDASLITIPLEQITWLPARRPKAAFIQICATLPSCARSARNGHETKSIAVLAVTDAGDITKEVSDIVRTARKAAESWPGIRLVTVGRGSAESELKFREALRGSSVDFRALGVLPAHEVSQVMADADVTLFVRGPVTTQRSSAIASIANGVPLVTYAPPTLPASLAEAGLVGVPYPDGEKLAEATVRVLSDPELRRELAERSRRAHAKYFSCGAVASRFLDVLHLA